jgi:hypothetical protein
MKPSKFLKSAVAAIILGVASADQAEASYFSKGANNEVYVCADVDGWRIYDDMFKVVGKLDRNQCAEILWVQPSSGFAILGASGKTRFLISSPNERQRFLELRSPRQKTRLEEQDEARRLCQSQVREMKSSFYSCDSRFNRELTNSRWEELKKDGDL